MNKKGLYVFLLTLNTSKNQIVLLVGGHQNSSYNIFFRCC